jgi:hypothetical protein
MESAIQIDDRHAFVFDLTWQTLDPMMSRASQLKELRSEYSAKWIASYKVHGHENVGYAKTLVLPPKIVTLSAAGQVAISDACRGRTVLVLMEEEGHDGEANDIGVVALINGNVVHDAWVKAAGAEGIRQEFQKQCDRASAEFVTMGKTFTLPAVDEKLEWADLLPKARGTGLAKFKKPASVPIVEFKADIPGWLMILVLAVGVIGAGLWFWDSSVTEANRLRLHSQQKKAPDPAQLYAASAATLLAQPVLPAHTALRELRAQLKTMPVQLAGWTLARLDCTVAGCSGLWSRKFGTYQEFVDRAPKEWGKVELHTDGTKIAHSLPVKFSTALLPAADKWSTEREFVLAVVSKWQKYSDVKFKADLQPIALMAVPPSVQPQVAAGFPNAIWAMKWSVKDTNWWMSEALDSLPSNVTLETVGLSFGAEINFNAEGKVYVHK